MITFLKKTFNLSGCEISINPESSTFHQGDEVKCSFNITGNEYQQTADNITVSLEESWEKRLPEPQRRVESWEKRSGKSTITVRENRVLRTVGTNVVITPDEHHKYEFTAKLPPNCRLSDASDNLGWCLVVTVDVPNSIDPRERLSIQVLPHREFEAIEHALMSELKFKSSSGKSFLPPEVLKSELDYLDLHFLQEGAITICELVFNLQEKSISDYFKAVLFQDSITREMNFSCDEIFDENWTPKAKNIANRIAEKMKDVLKERGVEI